MLKLFASIYLSLEYNANSNYDIFCFTQYNKFDGSEFLMHCFCCLEDKIYAKRKVPFY